jgi:hypothetical protein
VVIAVDAMYLRSAVAEVAGFSSLFRVRTIRENPRRSSALDTFQPESQSLKYSTLEGVLKGAGDRG